MVKALFALAKYLTWWLIKPLVSRCWVANVTRMLFQANACSSCFKQYFPFLLPNPNPLLNSLPVLVALKILREILSFTRSLMINTHPLVGCVSKTQTEKLNNSVFYLGLLQVVLFTVRRYIGLIECVWFCNETPDLYPETVTQHTLH